MLSCQVPDKGLSLRDSARLVHVVKSASMDNKASVQVHPCTGITHCTDAYFTTPARSLASNEPSLPDLVVVRSNLLQIYTIR